MDPARVYDCIIIGGGPAGLTCAIFLGRYLRKVLLLDTGRPRNYASRGIHGFLGQDSITPEELFSRGRREAESVGVEIVSHRATDVCRDGDFFVVTSTGGEVRGRRVVLAYGIRDTLPDIEGTQTLYGRGVYHCPDCDGYEIRDRSVGVIGLGKRAVHLALELLQWTSAVTIFSHGEPCGIEPEDRSKLEAEGIEVVEDRIEKLLAEDSELCGVRMEDGEKVEVQAIFFSIKAERSCDLAEQLGCALSGQTVDIEVDAHGETSVEGVYAVGDLVAGSKLVVTSAADGAIAAIAINQSLLPPARREG